ncbi:type II toxin-antitoxin system PemK/MazF family toxin [Yinghuangia soli]|uniref:Type II toxin-antitoxin system PemK/MazF family toxin n=1 Tax=Yinghuangia soli TaxID=2908204 RepID=A0AA41PXU0_9ACTN|nr:type II toxin-antitoxin system PemK/MazF family toxin [Yinghuangia soli]MCF2527718.1 type II toxin-antitoxin system PemK/MazF family toxin [Yinghuangia soli]
MTRIRGGSSKRGGRGAAALWLLVAVWLLLAVPGAVVSAALHDRMADLPGSGSSPWAVAAVAGYVGAFILTGFVAPWGSESAWSRRTASRAAVVAGGAFGAGLAASLLGPVNPYAAGLAAGALTCVVAWAAARLLDRGPARTLPRPTPGSAPQPGQIWFAAVPFDDSAQVKDRPCLVVGRTRRGIRVLKITSQDKSGRPDYVRMPVAGWDTAAKHDSWLELTPRRTVARSAFRRPLGVCDRHVWAQVTRRYPGTR